MGLKLCVPSGALRTYSLVRTLLLRHTQTDIQTCQ